MIINLTQHPATEDQLEQGVIDLKGEQLEALKELLTFDEIPSLQEVEDRAHDIALLAIHNGLSDSDNVDAPTFLYAMIGGAPFLMAELEKALISNHSIEPWYAFSKRESIEEPLPNGDVRKINVFRHIGFVGKGWWAGKE